MNIICKLLPGLRVGPELEGSPCRTRPSTRRAAIAVGGVREKGELGGVGGDRSTSTRETCPTSTGASASEARRGFVCCSERLKDKKLLQSPIMKLVLFETNQWGK